MRNWNWFNVISIMVAVVAIIVGVAQPEVRCFVGLQSESCPSSQITQTSPGESTQNNEKPKSSPPISTIEPSPKSSPGEPIQNDDQAKSSPSVSPSQPRTSLISKARGWWIWVRQELGKWWMWLVGVVVLVFVAFSCQRNTEQPRSAQRSAPPSVPTQYRQVELRSERGIDYTKLRDLLAAGKWKEADLETKETMFQAREKYAFQVEDLDNFPCEDLRTINQLWLHYSDGQFGFSVQKEIYESLGGTREYDEEVWKYFGVRVGWRKGGNTLHYSDLTFDLSAPCGHLPFIMVGGFYGFEGALLSRQDL